MIAESYLCQHLSPTQYRLQERYGKPFRDVLYETYMKHRSLRATAQEFGVHYSLVSRWMRQAGFRIEVETRATPTDQSNN